MKRHTDKSKVVKQLQINTILVFLILSSTYSLKGQDIDFRFEEDTFPSDSIPYIIETMDPEYDSQQFDDLKFQALQGDIHAYEEYYLRGHYGDENCLALAILMAKKYKYTIAFYDVYYILTEFYKRNDMPMDSSTVNYAIGFLKDGAELFDSKCCTELCRLHLTGEYVEKDTTSAKTYLYKIKRNDKDSVLKDWLYFKEKYYKDLVVPKDSDNNPIQ